MNRVKMTIAAALVLATGINAGMFAADSNTNATPVLNLPKITNPSANQSLAHGWYGPGYDGGTGYFNPLRSSEYDPYPFYNIVGGESFGPLYAYSLPDQNESPLNPQAALTQHSVAAHRLADRVTGSNKEKPAPVDRGVQNVR